MQIIADVEVEGQCVEVLCTDIIQDSLSSEYARLIQPTTLAGTPFCLKNGREFAATAWTVRRSAIRQYMCGALVPLPETAIPLTLVPTAPSEEMPPPPPSEEVQ
jgi:hypothetical protein